TGGEGRGRAGAVGRTLASRLCRFGDDRGTGRFRRSSRRRAEGEGDVRASDPPEPLRDPLPPCDGKAAGNAFAAPGRVPRDAGERRDDLPAAPSTRMTTGGFPKPSCRGTFLNSRASGRSATTRGSHPGTESWR